MAFGIYNNNSNQDRPSVNIYTPISFSNPASKVMDTRLTISYFNRVMCISIATRNNPGSNDYPTYDNDNQITVYVSYHKAKILHDAIVNMINGTDKNNVCIELKNGLLKVSNGVEYGTTMPCISISYADKSGNINEIVYETKATGYEAAYNYSDGSYSTMAFPKFEIETIQMVLEQYYIASSYAVAATVREAGMYRDKFITDSIKAIAEKVGASRGGNTNKTSFLNAAANATNVNNAQHQSQSGGFNGEVPKDYEQSTFADIANALMN